MKELLFHFLENLETLRNKEDIRNDTLLTVSQDQQISDSWKDNPGRQGGSAESSAGVCARLEEQLCKGPTKGT
jgi:hypothetical protein